MNIRKIITPIIIVILLSIIIIPINVNAVSNEDLELNVDTSKLEEGSVAVEILLHNPTTGISLFSGYFHYNKEVFEEINKRDIVTFVDEDFVDYVGYSNETNKIAIYFTEDLLNIEKLCTINLKVKENVNLNDISELVFSLGRPSLYSDTEEELAELENKEVKVTLNNSEPPVEPDDPIPDGLYLSTPLYKIGDNDIENYIAGDKYISKISQETTKQAFIHHLSTNGEIRILKHDGSELQDGEFVGTGMTLEVTKDEEIITLKIAVDGDLDGNGKVTATDLSTLNQTLLKLISLEDEYFLAADLDDSKKLTATDLSTEIKILIKLI